MGTLQNRFYVTTSSAVSGLHTVMVIDRIVDKPVLMLMHDHDEISDSDRSYAQGFADALNRFIKITYVE